MTNISCPNWWGRDGHSLSKGSNVRQQNEAAQTLSQKENRSHSTEWFPSAFSEHQGLKVKHWRENVLSQSLEG